MVAPAFVVGPANEVEPLVEAEAEAGTGTGAGVGAGVGVDVGVDADVDADVEVERGPGPVGPVLEVEVDPGLVLEVAGLVPWLALRLRLPPVEQRHRPYEDGHEDVLYRMALMRLVCGEAWALAEHWGQSRTCADDHGVSSGALWCRLH